MYDQKISPAYTDTNNLGPAGANAQRSPSPNLARRQSMEHEERPLPEGWLRQYDPASQHHFYVDTRTNPPRSIWNHPFDDDEYLRAHPEAAFDTGSESSSSDSSDSDSDSGVDKKKKKKIPKTKKKEDSTRFPQPQMAGPSDSGSGSQGRPGFFGMLKQVLAPDDNSRREQENAWNQRYRDRRQLFQTHQGNLPPQMAGPMYPSAVQQYAPPVGMCYRRQNPRKEFRSMYRQMRREQRDARKMGKRGRRDERRAAKRMRRDMRRGYAVPIPAQQVQQAPLFGYFHAR